jgi:hypothetical protein
MLPRTTGKPQQQQQMLLPKLIAEADTAAADADAKPQDQTDQAIVRVMTDPTAAADEHANGCISTDSGKQCCASSGAGVQSLFVSPLAPCVSLGSFSGQAWLKALLHGAAYAGEALL